MRFVTLRSIFVAVSFIFEIHVPATTLKNIVLQLQTKPTSYEALLRSMNTGKQTDVIVTGLEIKCSKCVGLYHSVSFLSSFFWRVFIGLVSSALYAVFYPRHHVVSC